MFQCEWEEEQGEREEQVFSRHRVRCETCGKRMNQKSLVQHPGNSCRGKMIMALNECNL